MTSVAQITGVVTASHEGLSLRLILGMAGLAKLQDEYGKDLAPLVAMFEDKTMPDFAVLLRVTQIGLERYHPDADPYLADDLLASDITVAVQLINAAFQGLQAAAPGKPRGQAAPGNGAKARGKAKAAKRG